MTRNHLFALLLPLALGLGCREEVQKQPQPRDTTLPREGVTPSKPVGGSAGDPARPGGGGAIGADRARDLPGGDGTGAEPASGKRDVTSGPDARPPDARR